MTKEKILSLVKNKKVILLFIFILFILVMAIFLSSFFSDYSKISLLRNKDEMFNVADLTMDNLTYMNTEKDLVKKYGKPNSTKKISNGNFKYVVYKYNGFDVTLKEYYDTYSISKVEVTTNKIKLSRGIKVGDRIVKVMNKFRVTNKKTSYMYSNYSSKALKDDTISDNIYFGKRTKSTVEYVNRDKKLSDNIDMPTNTARLKVNYKHGKVTKIMWSYDVE